MKYIVQTWLGLLSLSTLSLFHSLTTKSHHWRIDNNTERTHHQVSIRYKQWHPAKQCQHLQPPVQRVIDTKWLADLACVKIYQLHTIPGVLHLFASKNISTSLQVCPCFLICPHLSLGSIKTDEGFHITEIIRALSRWYGTAKHQYCGITTWGYRALAVSTRSTDEKTMYRGIQISWSCISKKTQSQKAKLIRICNFPNICLSARFDVTKSKFRIF